MVSPSFSSLTSMKSNISSTGSTGRGRGLGLTNLRESAGSGPIPMVPAALPLTRRELQRWAKLHPEAKVHGNSTSEAIRRAMALAGPEPSHDSSSSLTTPGLTSGLATASESGYPQRQTMGGRRASQVLFEEAPLLSGLLSERARERQDKSGVGRSRERDRERDKQMEAKRVSEQSSKTRPPVFSITSLRPATRERERPFSGGVTRVQAKKQSSVTSSNMNNLNKFLPATSNHSGGSGSRPQSRSRTGLAGASVLRSGSRGTQRTGYGISAASGPVKGRGYSASSKAPGKVKNVKGPSIRAGSGAGHVLGSGQGRRDQRPFNRATRYQ